MRRATISVVLLVSTLAGGCATITTGTDQGIRIVTEKNVTGARCTLVDSKGNRSFLPRTPGTTYMPKGDGPLIITCSKPGYKSTTLEVDEGTAGATVGNVLLGGGVGIIFDAASGAAQRYPDQVLIWMEPEDWPDEAARLEWQEEKTIYMEQLETDTSEHRLSEDEDDFQ